MPATRRHYMAGTVLRRLLGLAFGLRSDVLPSAGSNNPTLGIDYVNVTQRRDEADRIRSDRSRGSLVAEVKDVGTFSPGAEIKHKFGLNPNVFPIQTSYREMRSAEDYVRGRLALEESAPAALQSDDVRVGAALNAGFSPTSDSPPVAAGSLARRGGIESL